MRWPRLFMLPFCVLIYRSAPLQSQERKPSDSQSNLVAGRTLEYWISEISSRDQSKSQNAIRAVMLFGPERAYQAVPVILDRLKKHSPATRQPVDLSVR